ncbi:hypothetical protein HJG60_011219 [Phyllostomus discolor]|uniref:Uncharacterized protein n=1 Tax=Phyllostomus discolor TaxID=89673 RepID=A0A834E7K8_9CHIR|nr:hypothetical protein HJG60_011219 [Phyllostomus discolor]
MGLGPLSQGWVANTPTCVALRPLLTLSLCSLPLPKLERTEASSWRRLRCQKGHAWVVPVTSLDRRPTLPLGRGQLLPPCAQCGNSTQSSLATGVVDLSAPCQREGSAATSHPAIGVLLPTGSSK